MPGSYSRHLDDFGMCTCGNPSGRTESMDLESKNDRTGRYTVEKVPACADCFGLL